MMHPKMQYTYVGIDSHKDTHTAVLLNCFFEKLGELTFDNLPSRFNAFLADAQCFKMEGTVLLFGLEDTSAYGKNLMTFLKSNDQQVKHVSSLLVARERKNQNIVQKTDAVDAECAARVLLSKFGTLPDAVPEETYWILRSLVVRRAALVKQNVASKNMLHSFLTQHYPNYRQFFENIDCDTALAFFEQYPSPQLLSDTAVEHLAAFLEMHSGKFYGLDKAKEILDTLQDTAVPFQEMRDAIIQSIVKQVRYYLAEIAQLDVQLAAFLERLECPLLSMTGMDVVSAAQIMSCIGDIRKFSTPAKLARYAGIAPITYSSGKSDIQYANQRGNRELNTLFYNLAVRLTMTAGPSRRIINSFCYDYYHHKRSEGKTKRQALKCVERRLVNIVWAMLTNNEEYVNPPTYNAPPKI